MIKGSPFLFTAVDLVQYFIHASICIYTNHRCNIVSSYTLVKYGH